MSAAGVDAPAGGRLFNPEQRAALEVSSASVALSAGAGCGKTSVLSERFLRLLDGPDRLPLASIVALTFTEKAARELRDRVRAEVRRRMERGSDREHWAAIYRSLEAAQVGTFHAFCSRLLKRFALEAGVEPGFEVLDETLAPEHREAALQRGVRRWLAAGDEDFLSLAAEAGITSVRRSLAGLIASIDAEEVREWVRLTPEEITDRWRRTWEELVRPQVLEQVVAAAKPCLDLLRDNVPRLESMLKRREILLSEFPTLLECVAPAKTLKDLREAAKVQNVKAIHWPDPDVYPLIRDSLAELREVIDKALGKLSHDPEATREAAERALKFGRLALKALDLYDEVKREIGQLDFADLQLKTRTLLREHPAARARLRRETRALLVDEFQDTDPIQAEILEALAGEEFESGGLFLVGDVKQSIYRFRGARPTIFQEFRGRFPEPGRLALTRNYRSVPGVIDFVNTLFRGCFGDDAYDLQAQRDGLTDAPAVTFVWAQDLSGDDEAKTPAAIQRRTEARWLASELARRLADGWPIWDAETNVVRPAHAGDIAILFRTLNNSSEYERALADAGLEYHVVGGSAFYAQQEVLDVINLLAAVEDPLDPLPLAASLRGPFACLGDDGLFLLATSDNDLISTFAEDVHLAALSPADRAAVGRMRALLARLRDLKDRVPIATLLDVALEESGFEAALCAEFLGERKIANVRKMVKLARRYDAQGGFTLADFVARLKADFQNPPREDEASTTDEASEAVHLMTIHRAKGKEFPIVVVPDLNRRSDYRASTVVYRPGLGLFAKPADDLDSGDEADREGGKSLGSIVDRHIESMEEDQEALRLFYVATTRARDALILSAGAPADVAPASPAMRLLAARFDRSSGRPADDPSAGPLASVVASPPTASATAFRAKRYRPRYLTIAREIERAPVDPAPASTAAPRPSGLIALDPASGLSPSEARVDRLVRTILQDLRKPDRDAVEAASHVAARALRPAPSQRAVAEAVSRIGRWLSGEFARFIGQALRQPRFVPWTIAWPPEGEEPFVFHGSLDLVARNERGEGFLIGISSCEASLPAELLRLQLSARIVTDDLGLGPIREGWLVRLGKGGHCKRVPRLGGGAVDDAVREWLRSLEPGHHGDDRLGFLPGR